MAQVKWATEETTSSGNGKSGAVGKNGKGENGKSSTVGKNNKG